MRQSLNLTSVGNARELGGYAAGGKTVRHGVLLRTGRLSRLSDEDRSRLQDVYRVAVAVDFRRGMEREQSPDPALAGAETLALSVMDEPSTRNPKLRELYEDYEQNKLKRLMAAQASGMLGDDLYVKFLFSKQGRAGYRTFFDRLLSLPEGRACLWHCTAGKDRTGVAAMLVLTALGADRDTIMEDYLLTNEYNAELLEAVKDGLEDMLPSRELRDLALFGAGAVFERYMENALAAMVERCGSPEGYLRQELGLSDDELGRLRDAFLE